MVTTERIRILGAGNTYVQRVYPTPKGPYSEMTDLFLEADADTNSTGVAGGWGILYVDN